MDEKSNAQNKTPWYKSLYAKGIGALSVLGLIVGILADGKFLFQKDSNKVIKETGKHNQNKDNTPSNKSSQGLNSKSNSFEASEASDKSDYLYRKKTIDLFEENELIVYRAVYGIVGDEEYKDFEARGRGYPEEDINGKYYRVNYSLRNKYYEKEIIPLAFEHLVKNKNYIFKLNGNEYHRISIVDSINQKSLENSTKEIIKTEFNKYFKKGTINNK